MRKLAVSLALASTALATPALARDNSWYVGVDAGAMIVEDITFDITNTAGVTTNSASTLDHKYGYDFGGLVGYDFGGFRLEAEVGYRGARVDSYRSSLPVAVYTSTGGTVTAPAGNYSYAGRETTALSFMVNALLDFGDDDGLQGFVGGGAGIARVKEKIALNTFGDTINDSDSKFAWQALAGVRSPLTDHLDVSLKYRFFNVKDFQVVNSINGANYEGRFRSHSLLGGLTYNFGSPTPPPPPVIETPPVVETPPPVVETPPPPVCQPGPYIVFFDWDKSDIKPEAASILDEAIAKYQTCGNAQVMLAGHADKSGSATYNVGLSERRNASVQSYLTGHGIPGGVITTQAFGESRPRIETADGVREVANRRVEITYGPGSGM